MGSFTSRLAFWAFGLVLTAAAGCQQQLAVERGPRDLPRLGPIAIDGRDDDWGRGGLRIEALSFGRKAPATTDIDPRLRLAWDSIGLHMLLDVGDDVLDESAGDIWRRDSVEVVLGAGDKGATALKLIISPGVDPRRPVSSRDIYHYAKGADQTAPIPVFARRSPRGYVMEMTVPWARAGLAAKEGDVIALQVRFNDADGPGRFQQVRYGGPVKGMALLRLSKATSPPQRLTADARYESGRIAISVWGVPALAGRSATLRRGGTAVASARLANVGGRAFAALDLPASPAGGDGVVVAVPGGPAIAVDLPDMEALRRRTLAQAQVRFRPYVFGGRKLPSCEVVDPVPLKELFGSYDLSCDYYNAAQEKVAEADAPGRYGAVVTLRAGGQEAHRFATLYRTNEEVPWWQWRGAAVKLASAELPKGLGIDAAVLARQKETLSDCLKWRFSEALETSPGAAICLAGLHETRPDEPAAVARTGDHQRDRRWWFALQQKLHLVTTKYAVHLPAGYGAQPERRWPVLLILHGGGPRDEPPDMRAFGLADMAAAGRDWPFIVVAPAMSPGEGWLAVELGALLDRIEKDYRLDPDRVYVTGFSAGAWGTWAVAMEYPKRFAAIVPVCGGGDARDVERIRHLPVWVFHGRRDDTVPLECSREMVDALRAAGGHAYFTIYGDLGHNCWTTTYSDLRLYDWLLANRRGGKPVAPPSTQPSGQRAK